MKANHVSFNEFVKCADESPHIEMEVQWSENMLCRALIWPGEAPTKKTTICEKTVYDYVITKMLIYKTVPDHPLPVNFSAFLVKHKT